MPTPESQRRHTYLAVGFSTLAVLISLLASGFVIAQRINATNEARKQTNSAIRTVLCFARVQAEHSHVPEAQKKRAIFFYDRALDKIHAEPCGPLTHPGGETP